jgi:hypothetical protein
MRRYDYVGNRLSTPSSSLADATREVGAWRLSLGDFLVRGRAEAALPMAGSPWTTSVLHSYLPRGTTRVESVHRTPGRDIASGLLAVTLVLALAVSAPAAAPQIDRISPPGGQRGAELDLVLAGPRLADARGVVLYYPGIQVKAVQVLPDKTVKARLSVAADCRLGPHALRAQTASGISNLVTFSVGAYPEINEVEPNSEFTKPQKISLNTTVNGVVENEDVDYFLVEAKKGQRIAVEIEGVRLGETFFDPCVAIMDSNRFVLAVADDTPLVQQDGACSIIAPQDGNYIVQVRESAFGGSAQCRYRLHVGTFCRPLAAYPSGGKFGQSLDVRWLGDAAGPWTQQFTLPTAPQSMFGLLARDPQGVAPSPDPFRLSALDNVLEAEPNNKPEQATPFAAPVALNGTIGEPGDVDHFVFPAKKGQVFDVRVFARSLRTPLDSVLTIAKLKGGLVASNDDSNGPDSYVRLTVPEDGPYVISVTDQMGRGGPEYVYRIEVAPVEPRLTLGLPERTTYVDVVAAAPRGNRMAVMVGAQREDFGGDVTLDLQNLPPGMTAQTVPVAADQTAVPVLLTAAADAQPAAALVDVIGRHKEGERVFEGHLSQRTSLVRGENNREVWSHFTNRMAAAVTEPVPFRIDIVQPKVPLVQSGSMGLKVVATREASFKAPIVMRLLYTPPGVSMPDAVTIPEGQNEAVIPLTADGGATVRTWKIAVLGEATVGDGPIVVSSQLADLEVSEPLFRFKFQPAAVDQGQTTSVVVKIEKNKPFDGAATVELLGLPNEVTSQPREFTKDSTEVVFPLVTTAKSPPGLHKTLLCRAVVKSQGEPITHLLGGGELRIQPPPPPKPADASKPPPKPEPKPQPAAQRPLSRLEQLRLEKSGSNK